MGKKAGLSAEDERSLNKRYLFWLYKMTKDELDKIDRKFTQLEIDKEIQKLLKNRVRLVGKKTERCLEPFLKEWQEYIFQKASDAQKLKYIENGDENANYLFLHMKLESICRLIKVKFGNSMLKRCKQFYEEAAMKRILEDTSNKR